MAERTVRAFIAVPLTEEVKRSLAQLQDELRRRLGRAARWSRPESMHLTLRFLGDITEDSLDKIGKSVLSVSDSTPAFALRLQGLGVFPAPARPRVLWCGFSAAEQLVQLESRLADELAALGFPGEERPFAPHLTLARFIGPVNLQGVLQHFADFDGGALTVQELVLYESRLLSGGAQHLPRLVAPLQGTERGGAANKMTF